MPSRAARIGGLLILLFTATVVPVQAHSEFVSSTPAPNTTVPAPFAGPIVLTFSEKLASGSKVDFLDPTGKTIVSAKPDASKDTQMTVTLGAPLDPGAYTVKWQSIATDGDLLRGQFTVTVSAVASSSPAATASAPTPSGGASESPAASPSDSAAPAPSPSDSGTPASSSSSDVAIPIIVALVLVAAFGAWFLRRRGAAR